MSNNDASLKALQRYTPYYSMRKGVVNKIHKEPNRLKEGVRGFAHRVGDVLQGLPPRADLAHRVVEVRNLLVHPNEAATGARPL